MWDTFVEERQKRGVETSDVAGSRREADISTFLG